jgi:hypothetical protein
MSPVAAGLIRVRVLHEIRSDPLLIITATEI